MANSSIPSAATNPVVIGYGNLLRQDDGMGWQAAGLLRHSLPPQAARILQQQQLTPELVNDLEGAPVVVFLDAAVDLQPGEIRLSLLEPCPLEGWSHHLLPGQLLTLAAQVNGAVAPAFLIRGGVGGLDYSAALTAGASGSVREMADLALGLLQPWLTR